MNHGIIFIRSIVLQLIALGYCQAQSIGFVLSESNLSKLAPVFEHPQRPRLSTGIFEGMAVYPDSVVYEYYDKASQSHHIDQIVVYGWNNQTLPSTIKTYMYENGVFQHLSRSQFTYNTNGQLVLIETTSTDTSEMSNNRIVQHYNVHGDLISCKIFTPVSGTWQVYRHDSVAYEYADQKPVTIVRFYALGNDSLNAYRRFFDIQHNPLGQITSYKEMRKDIFNTQWEPGYILFTNLEWHVGYNDKLMGYYTGWITQNFIPTFPRTRYNLLKNQTSMTVAHVTPIDTNVGVIYSNNGWQQGQLTVFSSMRFNNSSRDTVESVTYRRDTQSRIVESKSRIRINRNLPWHNNNFYFDQTSFEFNALGFNTKMKSFERFGSSSGNWADSIVRTRHPVLGTSTAPQVWQMLDSIEIGGIKLPSSRETHFFGQNAASIAAKSVLNFSIHPNPAAAELFIRNLQQFGTVCDIRICNSIGQLVMQEQMHTANGDVQRIQLPELSSGIYLVLIESEKGFGSQRLVIR